MSMASRVPSQRSCVSSASVLMILEETLRTNPGRPGDLGLMMAMGPGFCSELLLLAW